MMLTAFLAHYVSTKYNFGQVERAGFMYDSANYFGNSNCRYDWLEIVGTKYCGLFKRAYTPGTSTYDNAPELPSTLSFDVNGRSDATFQFITDHSNEFTGFVFHWRLEGTS